MAAAIRLVDIKFAYGGKPALEKVSLEIKIGELAVLLGPNGCGKTTLLRCVARSLTPDAGKIFILGRDLKKYEASELARTLAFARQSPYYPPGVSAFDYAALGRFPHLDWTGLYKKRDREIAERVLNDFDIFGLARRSIDTLSGGERQTVALAQALIQLSGAERGVLLLDEPLSAMDWRRSMSVMRSLSTKKRFAILMSLHDANIAALFATRIIGLKNGTIIFNGNVDDAFTPENLSSLYDLDFGVRPHADCGKPQAYPRIFPSKSSGEQNYC